MKDLLQQLEEVRQLAILKHQAGRHSQSTHTPKKYGALTQDNLGDVRKAMRKDVEEYAKGHGYAPSKAMPNQWYKTVEIGDTVRNITVYSKAVEGEVPSYMVSILDKYKTSLGGGGIGVKWTFPTSDAQAQFTTHAESNGDVGPVSHLGEVVVRS